MITFKAGNMFEVGGNILVNTVNCKGIMGKGVALQFKQRYPTMFKHYKKLCTLDKVKPGVPYEWKDNNVIIVNFPTKDHWQNPSKIKYVENGIRWLRSYLVLKNKCRVVIPALGCGNGGLDWNIVKPLIKDFLQDLEHDIIVFEPISSSEI